MYSSESVSGQGCKDRHALGGIMDTNRILFLRTFRGDDIEKIVITRVASALMRDSNAAPVGRLVVIGNEASEADLSDFWAQATGSKGDFGDAVDYVTATDDSWKHVVHREIARCGCVILFLSPKDESFPQFEMPDANVLLTPGGYDAFYHLPMKENSTGKGLLQEVAYLERMERIDHTILLSHESHRQEVLKTIEHSYFAMYGDVTIFGRGGMRALHPRKTALEKKLGVLHDLPNFVSFNDSELERKQEGSSFTRLASIVKSLITQQDRGRESKALDYGLPIGSSPKPRRLPPDWEEKIISRWPVEDLVFIPPGNITEVPRERICAELSDEVVARGCPYCCSSLDNVFFYCYGLVQEHPDAISEGYVRGKCQACGRRCTHAYNMLSDQ